MNILELLNSGSKTLKQNKIRTHQLDSEIILSSLLKKQRESLLINLNEEIPKNTINNFEKLMYRRANREPLAYILKKKRILE